jgi:hypothetical protein
VLSWKVVRRAAGFGGLVQFPLQTLLLEVALEVE